MILTGKLPLLAIPVVVAFAWPFTATETLPLLIGFGSMVAAIIGAFKASSAKTEAKGAKLAVNGHLAKLEKEQEKAKSDRDAEFNRLLQIVKEASRAEGEEIARKAAEMLAAKVAEGVARDRADAGKVLVPVAVVPLAPTTPAPAPAKEPVTVATTVTPAAGAPAGGAPSKLKEAITDLTEAAKDTVVTADKTVNMVVKVPHT